MSIFGLTYRCYYSFRLTMLKSRLFSYSSSYSDEDAFLWYCERNNYAMVKYMKKDKVNPSFNDNLSLITATNENSIKVVILLLDDKRVDPTIRQNYIFKKFCDRKNTFVIEKILKNNNITQTTINYFLRYSIETKNVKILKFLINNKIVLSSNSDDINRVFITACRVGSLEIIKLLLYNNNIICSYYLKNGIYTANIHNKKLLSNFIKDYSIKRLLKIFKLSVWFIVWYKLSIKKRYHPNGPLVKLLAERFYKIYI